MKTFLLALVLAAGCTTHTQYGECKGVFDQDEKDPTLKYDVSTWNVVWAAIFSETLLWPVLTGGFWLWCPQGKK